MYKIFKKSLSVIIILPALVSIMAMNLWAQSSLANVDLNVDLKVNGSDGPVLKISPEHISTGHIIWEANGVTSCQPYGAGVILDDGTKWEPREITLPFSGERTFQIGQFGKPQREFPEREVHIQIVCTDAAGAFIRDQITLNIDFPLTEYEKEVEREMQAYAVGIVIGASILTVLGLFIMRLLLPVFRRVSLITVSALVAVGTLGVVFASTGFGILILRSIADGYVLTSFWEGAAVGAIIAYFLSFFMANFLWLLRMPQYHARAVLLHGLYAFSTGVLVLLFVFFFMVPLAAEGLSVIFIFRWILVGSGIAIAISLIIGFLMKRFIASPQTGEKSIIDSGTDSRV